MPPAEGGDNGGTAPAISVVIPLYNKAAYIARTLDSVAAQTFTDFEVVVVDDGSSDGSADIVAAYPDPRIRLIRQENGGQSVATNNAIRAARGDLIALLDGDDEWLPEHLEDLALLRREYPDAGLLVTGYRRLERGGLYAEVCADPALLGGTKGEVIDCFDAGIYGPVIWTGAVAIPSRVFDEAGLFLEGELRAQDIEMWARLMLRYPAAFHTRISALYHCEAAGRGMNMGMAWYPPFVRTADALLSAAERTPAALGHIRDYKHQQLLSYVARCASRGDRTEALRALREDMTPEGAHRRIIAFCRVALRLLPASWVVMAMRLRGSRWAWFGERRFAGGLFRTALADDETAAAWLARILCARPPVRAS